MRKSGQLLDNLKENVYHIDATRKQIEKLENNKERSEEDDITLGSLWRKEFSLCMDNSSIYDDLLKELKKEDEFTRKYMKQKADKFLKVKRIDV